MARKTSAVQRIPMTDGTTTWTATRVDATKGGRDVSTALRKMLNDASPIGRRSAIVRALKAFRHSVDPLLQLRVRRVDELLAALKQLPIELPGHLEGLKAAELALQNVHEFSVRRHFEHEAGATGRLRAKGGTARSDRYQPLREGACAKAKELRQTRPALHSRDIAGLVHDAFEKAFHNVNRQSTVSAAQTRATHTMANGSADHQIASAVRDAVPFGIESVSKRSIATWLKPPAKSK